MKGLKSMFKRRGFLMAITVAAAVALMSAPAVWAQGMEWEADEGLHQEEWYDPSDWFDNDAGIDYENDWYDYTYNYPETYNYQSDLRGYYGGFGEDYEVGEGPEAGYDYDYYTDNWFDADLGEE